MSGESDLTVAGLPPLEWLQSDQQPLLGSASTDGADLTLEAGQRTDWFIDPLTGDATASAPVLAFETVDAAGHSQETDVQLSVKVTVDFTSQFDAGVLFLHRSQTEYAKLCFERSPSGDALVVSVVTQGVSDDANGQAIVESMPGERCDDRANTVRSFQASIWLRVSTIGSAVAFHYSIDGMRWHLQRYFRLTDGEPRYHLGFCAQSPTGNSCRATFSDIGYARATLGDVRDGS